MRIKKIFACIMSLIVLISVPVSANEKNPYIINVNLTQNIVTVYGLDESGQYTVPVKAFYCSVGENDGTPTGTFYTSDKYVWRPLFGNVFGQYATRITGSILFHSVPYATQNKSTLKTDSYNKLGQDDSMGCVRMAVSDVKWIYDNCPTKTQVNMYKSNDPEPITPPEPIKIDTNDVNKGWDPTDPDENNPWKQVFEEQERELAEQIAKEQAITTYDGKAGVFGNEESVIEISIENQLDILNSKSQEVVIDLIKDVILLTDDQINARKAELAEAIMQQKTDKAS